MTNLKDIAVRTGLSINTVSRALRGRGYVSQSARDRVVEAARELGYRPNRAARSLRCHRSYEIAVINFIAPTGSGCDTLNMEKVIGMRHFLARTDYELSLHFVYYEKHFTAQTALQIVDIIEPRPAGVVLLGDSDLSLDIYRHLVRQNLPCVVISHMERKDVDCVSIGRQGGVYQAVRYLIGQGRRNICYAGTTTCRTRIDGYCQAIKEAGLREMIVEADGYRHFTGLESLFEVGDQTARKMLTLFPEADAVQAYSDYLAAGLCAGLQKLERRVPEDIAVVGFDNRELAMFTNPPLTTVAQPNWQAGEAAMRLLLQKIENKNVGVTALTVPMEIVFRSSA